MIRNDMTSAWDADKWKSAGRLVSSAAALVVGLIVLNTIAIPIWTEMAEVSSIAAGILHETNARGGALANDGARELAQRLSTLNSLLMSAVLSFLSVLGRSITGLQAAGRSRIRLSWMVSLVLGALGVVGCAFFQTSGYIVLILAIPSLSTVLQDYLTAAGDELPSKVGQGKLGSVTVTDKRSPRSGS